ncbi:hypothetical protein [Rhodoplanes azumiensis]|uniref:Glycosyltransferase RgtA/B/C/D-like domain-containing protein n=1 Tax=Rhodoplanes azumiensis TaxID=1897628 RepID=A0ABW5AKU6_9BRAD
MLGDLPFTAARSSSRPPSAAPATPAPRWAGRLAVLVVAALALALAAAMLRAYWWAPETLWTDVHHDRDGHFGFGLDLALALRTGDLGGFVSHLSRSVVWPPVNGLLLAAVMLPGGPDLRLAIVPALLGWILTVVLTAVLARRLVETSPGAPSGAVPPGAGSPSAGPAGAVAAAVAGALALSAPAFALLGSDVMLETLGAALSALTLLCFLRAMETPRHHGTGTDAGTESGTESGVGEAVRRWRMLGLVLTVLFFHKGNYWGLVVASLVVTVAIESGVGLVRRARAAVGPVRALRPGRVVTRLSTDPLLIAALGVAVLVAVIYRRGPTSLDLFGRPVSLYPPENLVTVAYALLFARAVVAWRRHRDRLASALGVPGRAILAWHVLPVAVSFLIPKRLPGFLWFVSPANGPADATFEPLSTARFYATAAADGFHATPTVAVATLVLFATALVFKRRWPPGGRAVIALALVGTAGVIVHPHHQARFLASWLFAWWVGAGVGAGVLVAALARRWPAGAMVAGTAVSAGALVAAVTLPGPPSAAARAVAIRETSPSTLALVTPLLPELVGARTIGVVSSTGRTPFFAWALRVVCRCAVPVTTPWMTSGSSREAVAREVAGWLATTPADRLLVADIPMSALHMKEPGFAGAIDALATQTRYVPRGRVAVPAFSATVSVWERR